VLSAEYNWWMQQGQHAVTITRDGVDFILNRFYSGIDSFFFSSVIFYFFVFLDEPPPFF